MKKLLLIAALLVASFGAFAEEDFFDIFVAQLKSAPPEGGTIRASKEHRIVFMDMRVPEDSSKVSEAELGEFKKMFIQSMGPEAAKHLKENNVSIFVNLITSDVKIITVIVTPNDL